MLVTIPAHSLPRPEQPATFVVCRPVGRPGRVSERISSGFRPQKSKSLSLSNWNHATACLHMHNHMVALPYRWLPLHCLGCTWEKVVHCSLVFSSAGGSTGGRSWRGSNRTTGTTISSQEHITIFTLSYFCSLHCLNVPYKFNIRKFSNPSIISHV